MWDSREVGGLCGAWLWKWMKNTKSLIKAFNKEWEMEEIRCLGRQVMQDEKLIDEGPKALIPIDVEWIRVIRSNCKVWIIWV